MESRGMIQTSQPSSSQKIGVGRIAWWLLVGVSFALLIFLLVSEILRFSSPVQLHRLKIVQDVPLPDALPDPQRSKNPFVSGKAQRFDHFDFQSYDPNTHLLFIVHTGPNPDKEAALEHNPNFDEATDGNVVVFNTQLNKVVGLITVPQAAGILVVPSLGKVYVGSTTDQSIISIFSERSPFQSIAQVKLDPLDGPDAIEYDPVDQLIFVAAPGVSANPDDANVALKNQNVVVIDAITNKLIKKIPFGLHKPFGDDVGHIQFDPVTHRIFVTTFPLIDQNKIAEQTPPFFLAVIDPTALKVVANIRLPDECVVPHGVLIDAQQREAFVACVDSQNLVRVDLKTMKPFNEPLLPTAYNPDIVRLDHKSHLLVVGCAGGISLFDESGRQLKALGNYFLGGGSHHTVAIDEAKQIIYLPQPSVGDRPILHIIQYVPSGT